MFALICFSSLGLLAMFSEFFGFRKWLYPLTLLGLSGCLAGLFIPELVQEGTFFGMMRVFPLVISFEKILVLLCWMWFMACGERISRHPFCQEILSLSMFGMAGALLMISFSHLVMLFLGIEILSISMYILAGINKNDGASNEAAIKYFITGAFSTGFFLFGVALIFGASGSFYLNDISGHLHGSLGIAGMLFILASMLFKIGSVPFHFWAPDVYEGSPLSITAFMATLVKTAALGAFFILFTEGFRTLYVDWEQTIAVLACLTILLGNVTAIFQQNFKRMLAYSGIAHAGYMMMTLVSDSTNGTRGLLFYSFAYGAASLTAFAIAMLVGKEGKQVMIEDFRGLWKRNKLAGLALSVSMLSLAGIPGTAGFFGKFTVFLAALQQGQAVLVFVAILGTMVSVYYYFRVIHEAVLGDQKTNHPVLISLPFLVVILFGLAMTLGFGFFPGLSEIAFGF